MWSDLQQFKADFFKALSHPLPIRILEIIAEGEKFLYSLRDPAIVDLLRIARELFNKYLINTLSMYEELEEQKK
ncbi:hypothetical protein MHH81_19940 [Psychrobacillus sp. FSL H8-0484]|uniref:hypothetical protein n=1 Tax=Psychrobacillus sp. FSL H8-0484 TaxID=2921390 RepID=UPI0030F7B590